MTGIDLVQEQLRLAAGEPLGYEQADVTVRGWAIECRISAEDPGAGFLPSPGRVAAWRAPGGPWTRVDAGVYDGVTVPLHYDPLMAKLVVWGRDRAEAICRMASALDEFAVAGVRTTIPFHQAVMRHPDFREPLLSRNLTVVKSLRVIGRSHARTAAQVAVAWVLRTPAVTGAIVGARRPGQVRGVVGAAEFRLSSREVAEIEDFFAKMAA